MSPSRRNPIKQGSFREHGEESVAGARPRCDRCGARIQGEPASRGLLLWSRGDEVRYEEPPLCERCAGSVPLGLLFSSDAEGE